MSSISACKSAAGSARALDEMQSRTYADVTRDFLNLVRIKPSRPDLELLEKLTRAFSRFPYENFTKIIRAHEYDGIGRLRTPEIIFSDHIECGAGGTCFSLTYFFDRILLNLDFETYPVLCDRSYGPNTHSALVVKLGYDRYLVDPGYLMEAPLMVPVRGESRQEGRIDETRLLRLGESSQLMLFSHGKEKSKLRYRLKDIPVEAEEFKQRWLDSFGWAMMRHPCISQMTPEGQIFMRDMKLRVNKRDEKSQETLRKNFLTRIEKTFKINSRLAAAAMDYAKK